MTHSITTTTDPGAILTGLLAVAIDTADSETCASLLGDVKRVRGALDVIESRLTKQLRHLHDTAATATAADEHARCGGVSAREGKRKERRSETLDDAPSFENALGAGEIGAEHVDALADATAGLKPEIRDELLDLEDDLLSDAKATTPEKFGRQVRELIRRLERDHGLERNKQQRDDTFLGRKVNPRTGMTEGRFALHPELANQIFGAIDKEVAAIIKRGEQSGDPEFTNRSFDRRRLTAEAWGNLVAGGHQAKRPSEADVTVIVDWRTAATGELHPHSVCETSDGSPLPPASIRRLVCSARIVPIIIDESGARIDAGRAVRTANRAQRRALRALYRTCAFGECDVAFDRCEIHHIVPWELGGLTDLHNLIPLCSRHHHTVHDHGWHLDLAVERALTIRRPDGTVYLVCQPDLTPRSTSATGEPARRHRRQPAA